MNKETLKKSQQLIIDKYNRCSSKVRRREFYLEICRYEDLLSKLREDSK